MESNLYGLTAGRQSSQKWATPPATFTATAASDSVITLEWDNTEADYLHMQIQAKTGTDDWEQIAEVHKDIATVNHTELEADTEYSYRHRCYLYNKWTPWSEAIEETTEA